MPDDDDEVLVQATVKRSAREWLAKTARGEGLSSSAYLRRIIYMVMAKSGSGVPGGLIPMGTTHRAWGLKTEQGPDDAALLQQHGAPPTFLLERLTDNPDGSFEGMMHHPISTPASHLPYLMQQFERNLDLQDTISHGWLALEGSPRTKWKVVRSVADHQRKGALLLLVRPMKDDERCN